MKARLFALVFIVAGLALAYAMTRQIAESLAPYGWEKTECLIKKSDVVYGARQQPACTHSLAYAYETSGGRKTGDTWRLDPGIPYARCSDWASFASKFPPNATMRCHVDPRNSDRAVLDRGNIFSVFALIVPLGLLLIGMSILSAKSFDVAPSKASVRRLGQGIAVCIIVAGAVGTLFFGVLPLYGSYDARAWNKAECEVLSSGLRTSGSGSAPGSSRQNAGYYIDIVYTYAVDGQRFVSDRYDFDVFGSGRSDRLAQVIGQHPVGAKVSCSVHPDNPYEAVLTPGPSVRYLWGFLPLLGVPIGFLLWVGVRRIR
jgi:Protein of unknown function (DUF3592)